jgi:VWFA-related protein
LKTTIRIAFAALAFLPAFGFTQEPAPAVAPAAVPSAQPAAPAPQAPALNPRPAYTPAGAPQEGRIHLDVVVTDKSGKPVSGLELKDFTLKDNTLPAKILSFHANGPDIEKAGHPAELVILLDSVNLGFDTVARMRDQIAIFLRQNGGHLAQPVSIFVFNNEGIKVLLQPSVDGNAMAAQLVQTDLGLRVIGRSAGANGAIERFQLSLKWLTAIARSQIKRPGRKLLIWAGPGWPLLDRPGIETSSKGAQQLFEGIVDLSTTLREARTSLYSVNLGMPGLGTFLYQDFVKGVKTAEKAVPSDLNLKVIATQTGGLVIPPDNDLASQIAKCAQDASAFYTLSFDPPQADKANENHDLKVEIDQPGLTARTSTGYYNQP